MACQWHRKTLNGYWGAAINGSRTSHTRFAAWFDSEMDRFMASAQSKARAKFAAQAMAGSVPHFVALGWSEAKRRCVPTLEDRSADASGDDGPAPMSLGP